MQKEIIQHSPILLIGKTVRTNNAAEHGKLDGKIFPLVRAWYHDGLPDRLPNRKKPGATFCCYTDYERDHTGDYTYFIGEEVTELPEELPEGFVALTIPAQTYAKFTTDPAPMPDVLTNAWKEIWEMTPEVMGGTRRYHTDFEIYDERAADHQNIVMDLFIGLKD